MQQLLVSCAFFCCEGFETKERLWLALRSPARNHAFWYKPPHRRGVLLEVRCPRLPRLLFREEILLAENVSRKRLVLQSGVPAGFAGLLEARPCGGGDGHQKACIVAGERGRMKSAPPGELIPKMFPIRRGIERGEFQEVDAQATATTLVALYEGLALLYFVNPKALQWTQQVETSVRLLLAGIQKPPSL